MGSNGTMSKIVPVIPTASELLYANDDNAKRLYWDKSHYESIGAQKATLAKSATLYIGNLSFSTRTQHIRSHFAQIGRVKQVVLGLDRMKKTPCGFCFVEYYSRCDALLAISNLTGTKLDGRIMRVELDAGFQPGRQYGRGKSGGQVRDDKRGTVDPGRRSRNGGFNNAGGGGGAHYGPGTKRDRFDQSDNSGERSNKRMKY